MAFRLFYSAVITIKEVHNTDRALLPSPMVGIGHPPQKRGRCLAEVKGPLETHSPNWFFKIQEQLYNFLQQKHQMIWWINEGIFLWQILYLFLLKSKTEKGNLPQWQKIPNTKSPLIMLTKVHRHQQGNHFSINPALPKLSRDSTLAWKSLALSVTYVWHTRASPSSPTKTRPAKSNRQMLD